MKNSLFREEVLKAQQTQWLGTVLLAPSLSQRLFVVYACCVIAALLALLNLGEYTRSAKVSGWLVPEQGMVRVFTPHAGVVTRLNINEGSRVNQGDSLLSLSTELHTALLGDTQAEVSRGLRTRRLSLLAELSQQKKLFKQRLQAFARRISALRAEETQIKSEIALESDRMTLAQTTANRQLTLRQQGYISEQQLQQATDAKLEQAAKISALERQLLNLARERLNLESDMNDLPLQSQSQIANIERDISSLDQELVQTEAKRETVITASQAGTITGIQVEMGGHVNTANPLLSILPEGAVLQAHLYTPSRSIGFVKTGQNVLLRYQAYPYQKFGHYRGTVTHISRTAMSPNELPPQIAGLSNALDKDEPLYRITVSLEKQAINAYGELISLQAGMQVEADVMIERRKLYEWLLDPLFTLTGKWST